MSRSIITSDNGEIASEPKILQVLLLLAKNQGQVVTHDEIMKEIWPDVEVVPNALQRCITHLRKALGDNGKLQHVIVTHPRIGYSLIAEVKWPSVESSESATNTPSKNTTFKALTFLTVVIFILLIFGFVQFEQSGTSYTKIRQITQSDEHESDPMYSLDGEYIVFNRHIDVCEGNLWAKNIKSGQEVQLTQSSGIYGKASFTSNGSELVFAAKSDCQTTENQQQCWFIASLDFAAALTSPQALLKRFECSANRLETPKSINNNQYAFLQFEHNRYSLMTYNDRDKTTNVLYQPNDKDIYYIDYNPINQQFAVMSRNHQQQMILEILSINGEVLFSKVVNRPEQMSQYDFIEPNFTHQGDYLITSSYLGPYKLSLEAELIPIQTPEKHLFNIDVHPSWNNLIAIRGQFDQDIAEIKLTGDIESEVASGFNQLYQPYASFARTTSAEHLAKYQPHGDSIAFISNRTGEDQLWLWHKNKTTQLTFANNNRALENYVWSPDGKQLAYVLNDQITLTDLNNKSQTFPTPEPIIGVINWFVDNKLLVVANTHNIRELFSFDLTTNQLISLGITHVNRAWTNDKNLIYTDKNNDVWLQDVENLNKQKHRVNGVYGKSMFVKNGKIYWVNPTDFTLTERDLTTGNEQILTTLKDKAWWVSDIYQDQLLLNQAIAARKEIVLVE